MILESCDTKLRNVAKWHYHYTGGIAFSERPLERGYLYRLSFKGTCHASFGVVQKDPLTIPNVRSMKEDLRMSSDIIRMYRYQVVYTVFMLITVHVYSTGYHVIISCC